MKAKKIYSEDEIRDIIQREISGCFEKLTTMNKDIQTMRKAFEKTSSSVERIERLLIGDEQLKDEGYAEMIKYSYNYSRKFEEMKLINRMETVIGHFEQWNGDGRWATLTEIIDKYKIFKWLTAIMVSSGVISLANIISVIIHVFSGT